MISRGSSIQHPASSIQNPESKSKIQSHCKITHRLAFKDAIHFPGRIQAKEISKQCAANTKAITTGKRADATRFDFYNHRVAWNAIKNGWSFNFIIGSIPCCAQVKELHHLEIPEKCIVDRFVKQGAEYRQANFTIDHRGIISIRHILSKPSQVKRQGLKCIIYIGIRLVGIVEFWEQVIVNATEIIDDLLRTPGNVKSTANSPNAIAKYREKISSVTAEIEKIRILGS